MTKKKVSKDNRSDLEMAAEGAANIYKVGKMGFDAFGTGLGKGLGIIKPTNQEKLEKLKAKVDYLSKENNALKEIAELKKQKDKIEQEMKQTQI